MRPRVKLSLDERRGHVGEFAQDRRKQFRIPQHHGLGFLVVLTGATLNEVAGHRKRRSREPDQRGVVWKTLSREGHRLGNRVAHFCCEVWGSGQVFTRAHWVGKHWAHTRFDLDVHSGDLQRHNNVGEEDSRVYAVPTHRLQGDLGGEIGHEAGVEHRDSFARFPVLRKRPASLPHKPHGSTTDRLRQCSTSKRYHALHLFRLTR